MIYSTLVIFQNTRVACVASRAASPNRNNIIKPGSDILSTILAHYNPLSGAWDAYTATAQLICSCITFSLHKFIRLEVALD